MILVYTIVLTSYMGQDVFVYLFSELGHDGINPWESSGCICPLGQGIVVVVPGDLKMASVTIC